MPYSHGRACRPLAVVGGALLEGDAEHLAEQRLGLVDTDAADEIAEHDGRVAVEQHAEAAGFVERRRDHRRGIGVEGHHHVFPVG